MFSVLFVITCADGKQAIHLSNLSDILEYHERHFSSNMYFVQTYEALVVLES